MAKDKDIFSALNECNTKKIFVSDDKSLSVVGSGKTLVKTKIKPHLYREMTTIKRFQTIILDYFGDDPDPILYVLSN
jgi:hypothetical protein